MENVWVFVGAGAKFPSGIFKTKENAEKWIAPNKLSGVLTEYPINIAIYDWAISQNYFVPKKEHEFSKEFIQRFTCASQKHYHYEDGKCD